MKQKKSGKKVINWHRPLIAKQRRQRYIQRRLEQFNPLAHGSLPDEGTETDEYWDPHDPYWSPALDSVDDPGDIMDQYWTINEIVRRSLNSSSLSISTPIESTRKTQRDADDEVTSSLATGHHADIENRLAEFFTILRDPKSLEVQVQQYLADPRDRRMLKLAAEQGNEPWLAIKVGLFAPFWIRSPHTWDQQSNFLDHVFVRHPVPQFLYSDWTRRDVDGSVKWLIWFILLGQGGSLKRAGKLFNWCIPTKLLKSLNEFPPNLSPLELCMLAEIKRLGGNKMDFDRLNRHLFFVIDPTEPSSNNGYLPFWRETVRWLSTHRAAMSDEESQIILTWAVHEYTEAQRDEGDWWTLDEYPEAQRDRGQRFSWKGRRVHTVLERSRQYCESIERPWLGHQWSSHDWDWKYEDVILGTWTFIELTSGEDLFYEGQAQNHCVASYSGRCTAGHSAVVSLQHNDERRLTVEINPSTGQIVQARGPYNRSANTQEQRVLTQWVQTVIQPNYPSQAS